MLNVTDSAQENGLLRKIEHNTEFSQKNCAVLIALIEVVKFYKEHPNEFYSSNCCFTLCKKISCYTVVVIALL